MKLSASISWVMFFLGLVVHLGVAQTSAPQLLTLSTPLEHLLNADGTVNLMTGISGSLDLKGWQMDADNTGRPRFVRRGNSALSVPEDSLWDGPFCPPGTNNAVYALAVMGPDLYVGGVFTTAGGDSTNYIAKWDGMHWLPLGSGVDGGVTTLAVYGGELYAGGLFTKAGGVNVNFIARWNGSSWSAVGSGTGGFVYTLLVMGTDLYVGGKFTTVGAGVSANNIARWNGSGWSALGSGLNDFVYTLTSGGTNLYAGGTFTKSGSDSMQYIAKWNGLGWSALGSGMNGYVRALGILGSDIVAGGSFTNAGGTGASYLARWSGSTWSGFGSGLNGPVYSLCVSGTNLYSGGTFNNAGGVIAVDIARWNGSSWSALSAMNGQVNVLAVQGADILAGGLFTFAGTVNANYIARWDNFTWSSLGAGLNADVLALAVKDGDLYAGGNFTRAGGDSVNYIARWDGRKWSPLGTGMNLPIISLAVIGTDLYAYGRFTTAGGVPANNIAKWNGTSWSALGSGLHGFPYALTVIGTNLYAGGDLGLPYDGVAKWNGSSWSGCGQSPPLVYALAPIGTDLYVGGAFGYAGGMLVNYIAKWGGNNWAALDTSLNRGVCALAVIGTDLYAFGGFSSAGGHSVNCIAKWNGSHWSSLGSGIRNTGFMSEAWALQSAGLDLYAGGNFRVAGGDSADRIARWDGSEWTSLGSGLDGACRIIYGNDRNLYVGGSFTRAGSKPSFHLARWIGRRYIVNTEFRVNMKMKMRNGTFRPDLGDVVTLRGTFNDWGNSTNNPDTLIDDDADSLYTRHLSLAPNQFIEYKFWKTVRGGAMGWEESTGNRTFSLANSDTVLPMAYFNNEGPPVQVAFQVNMNVMMEKGSFLPDSGDVVTVRGSYDGWGGSPAMADSDGDGIYTIRLVVPSAQTIQYKFFKTLRGGLDWEGSISNRESYLEPETPMILSPVYFNNDSISPIVYRISSGWNILSVPVILSDMRGPEVFPSATSWAFTYRDHYILRDTLETGTGYWLKFSADTNLTLTGLPVSADTFVVLRGWNMIGSISRPFPVVSIASGPPGIVSSRFFGYNGAYFRTDTIQPGQGYWVKVNQSGELVLSSTSTQSSALLKFVDNGELPPPPPDQIESAITEIPKEFELAQSYPNPANPQTVIKYGLPKAAFVSLKVYNSLGAEIGSLVNESKEAGYYQAVFDGNALASGVYFYRISAGDYTQTKKLVLMK